MKRNISFFLSLIALFSLTGCASITRHIESSANSPSGYGAATTSDQSLLQEAPQIDLSHYKSVQTRPNQRSDIAIAVAASGGGYRAANFAAGVLMGLENMSSPYLRGNLLQEVDYFSSVSGGGFAVGYYEASLYNYWYRYRNVKNPPPYSFTKVMQKVLRSDSGPAILSRNVLAQDFTDVLFFGTDRGLRWEQNMNKTVLATPDGGLTLGDIFVPKNSTRPVILPYWVTNATIYQNSQMLPFSPDELADYQVRGYWHNMHYYWMNTPFNSDAYAQNFPASVGVTASAGVPFAFPTTTLTSQACTSHKCYLQLLDGGMSDNLGVFSAVNFLIDDPAKIKVLIIIDASNSSGQPFSKSKNGPTGFTLLWQMFNMTTDSLRNHIHTYIQFTAKDILCARHAKNVVVIYINLAEDAKARSIGTSLQISPADQRYLIQLGQKLVMTNPQMRQFLNGVTLNGLNVDACPAVNTKSQLSVPN